MSGPTLAAPNRMPLFIASCTSLVTTSMVFATRGAITGPMAEQFHLTNEAVGWLYSPSFWGFTIAIFVCGVAVDFLGMRLIHALSSIGYLAGLALVLLAPKPELADAATKINDMGDIMGHTGTAMLFAGFLLMGLSQGLVEGVINPLVATLFSDRKSKMLNMLHAFWPAGMIIGGVAAFGLGKLDVSWQVKLGTLAVPATIALFFVATNKYPKTERAASNVSMGEMFKEAFNPLFLLLFGLMWLTAATELAPDQWFGKIMGDITGMKSDGILFLCYTAGLMFVLRFFFGGVVHKFSPFAVLSTCSVLAAAGLFWLSTMEAGKTPVAAAFAAATLFGVGKTFYWPTMLGVTSERFPKGGAFLMNLMGGAGMLSIAIALPMIGKALDKPEVGVSGALRMVSFIPGGLVVVFAIIALVFKAKGGYKAVSISHADEAPASEL